MSTRAPSHTLQSLPRCPLVPDEVLKNHNCYFSVDTRFRRAARLLQVLWLKDRNIDPGIHVRGEGDNAIVMPLHSNLSGEAASRGQNFFDQRTHAFVRRELLMREEGAAIDEQRLFGNAVSSMPLVFNIFAPLALDRKLATRVFRHLFPDFVTEVTGFKFETSPGRREERFLNDGTAFDLAVQVVTPADEAASIFIEVKYSEDMMGPAARLRPRYDEVTRASGLFVDPDDPMLRTLALEQLWREHMLAQLIVDQKLTARAMFVAIGPRLNRRVQAAFRAYEHTLLDADHRDASRVPFQCLTLEHVIDAVRVAGAIDLAANLWSRYCDFQRIYELALSSFNEDTQVSQAVPAIASDTRPIALPVQRRTSARLHRKTGRVSQKKTSSAKRG